MRRLFAAAVAALLPHTAFAQVDAPCPAPFCAFANDRLRFGTGTGTSFTPQGLFMQPSYLFTGATPPAWRKLTFSTYPLDLALGVGRGTAHWTGSTVTDISTQTSALQLNDYTRYNATARAASGGLTGHGTVVTARVFTVQGTPFRIVTTYGLRSGASQFVRVKTNVTNLGSATAANVRLWVGTRDDFVGLDDRSVKVRGTINPDTWGFEELRDASLPASAILVSGSSESVLFYSPSPGVDMSFSSCCLFSRVYDTAPAAAGIRSAVIDGSYAAVLAMGDLPPLASRALVWYYAASSLAQLDEVVESVAESAEGDTPTPSPAGSPSGTVTPSRSPAGTPPPTETSSGSASGSPPPTASSSPSLSRLALPSVTATGTASPDGTPPATDTPSPSATPSGSATGTGTGSDTASGSPSGTPPPTGSGSGSGSGTPSASVTPSPTGSPTASKSVGASASQIGRAHV